MSAISDAPTKLPKPDVAPVRLATFAALGMAYYLAAGVLLHWLRPDYSLLESGMSCYAVGPYGWLETLAFILDGLSLGALALGLARTVGPAGRSRVGLALLALTGAVRALEAAFPTDVPPGPVPRTATGEMHFLVAFLVFMGVSAAVLILSARLGRDPAWQPSQGTMQGLAWASLAAVMAFFAIATLGGLWPPAAAGRQVVGLVEKAFLALWHIWVLAVALRLRAIAP